MARFETLDPEIRGVLGKKVSELGLRVPRDVSVCGFDGFGVARVGMAYDTHTGIRRQHALQAAGGFGRAVGDDDLPGMLTVADAHPTAVMERYPGRTTHCVNQCVKNRPVTDGIRAVMHGFSLAVGRGYRPGIEVIATYDDWRLQFAAGDHLIKLQPCPGSFTIAKPADAGG